MTDIVERLRNWSSSDGISILSEAADEIERLRAALVGHGRACFSEAREMADEVERLRNHNDQLLGYTKGMEDEAERLRAALRACIKSAEADDPLKESGWWDEQSIVAIERALGAIEMTDIVERLRQFDPETFGRVHAWEAADEIKRLRAEIERLKVQPQTLQFQPNNRALLRDIIRTLILEIRVLRLELKQRDQQSGRS